MATGTGNLPFPGKTYSPFAILTAEEMNEDVANIESLADGSGLGDSSIPNAALAIAEQNWTPTFTNLSGGTLTYAKYQIIGKRCWFRLLYTLSGANVSGTVSFSFPVTPATGFVPGAAAPVGTTTYIDNNATWYNGFVYLTSGGNLGLTAIGTNGAFVSLSSSSPFTWANGDRIYVNGSYPVD